MASHDFEKRGLVTRRQFGVLVGAGACMVLPQVANDGIADSLNIKPAKGALVEGVEDKGPAKPAGIEPGDVIVKFDGKDVKEPVTGPRQAAW